MTFKTREIDIRFYFIVFNLIVLAFSANHSFAQTNNEVFARLVGPETLMDSTIVRKVLAGKPGQMFFLDSDNDGKDDAVYFIDTDERHDDHMRPILVKVVDQDGDMHWTRKGDYDSDLWIADCHADGEIDRCLEYIDLDHDNDMDEQVFFFKVDSNRIEYPGLYPYRKRWNRGRVNTDKGEAYFITWHKDFGDDNKLMYDINYDYYQPKTEWLSGNNGDEQWVYPFYYDFKAEKIIPISELSFSWHDPDGDGYSEEAVRFSAAIHKNAKMLRYSMDVENNTYGSVEHDYDMSISCVGHAGILPENI